VERLQRSENGYVLSLNDRTDVTARAVVLATGVEWRRLAVPSVEALLGAGVFYGAAGSEADALRGEPVFVVGGGNSAGQAAVHLARHAKSVTILIRSESLTASMSDYLIQELEAIQNVTVRGTTEVVGASGKTRLQKLTLRLRQTGAEEQVDAAALLCVLKLQSVWSGVEPFRHHPHLAMTATVPRTCAIE
jgi:thioredoxin reductase (NADPH)